MAFLIMLLFQNCNQVDIPSKNKYISYQTDFEKYQEIRDNPIPESCSSNWDVRKVITTRDTLTIEVSRPENCNVQYEIIWDGYLMESHPVQVNFLLYATFENCPSQAGYEIDSFSIHLPTAFAGLNNSLVNKLSINILERCSQ